MPSALAWNSDSFSGSGGSSSAIRSPLEEQNAGRGCEKRITKEAKLADPGNTLRNAEWVLRKGMILVQADSRCRKSIRGTGGDRASYECEVG